MTFEVTLLGLRIAATALLYLFLLGVVAVMWFDWRAVARQTEHARRVAGQSLGRLIILDGGETDLLPGQSWPISVVTGLGRSPANTVVIEAPYASTEHALISRRNDRWWLEDLDSTNGTYLNGERLGAPTIVVTGDQIGVAGVRLRIELDESEQTFHPAKLE